MEKAKEPDEEAKKIVFVFVFWGFWILSFGGFYTLLVFKDL